MADRLLKLDKVIKAKIASIWVSVRKAFLEIDSDKDGFITAIDILRIFGDNEEDLADLETLMRQKQMTTEAS